MDRVDTNLNHFDTNFVICPPFDSVCDIKRQPRLSRFDDELEVEYFQVPRVESVAIR